MHIQYAREGMAVLIVIMAAVALYFTFAPIACDDYTCFAAHMAKCRPATFVNEEDEASWQYEIRGTADGSCESEVTLLNAKDGDLGLRAYEGQAMSCYYEIGVVGYPEKNLAACRGDLKEGLQAIVIEKLYKYIVANLGDIREELLL